jgi:hypothetical protein
MKTILPTFKKCKASLLLGFILFLSFSSMAQYVQPLGTNGSTGTVKVTSSGGSVAGNNTYFGSVFFGTNNIETAAANGWINTTFNSLGQYSRFKAVAGQPVTITIEFDLNLYPPEFIAEITDYTRLQGKLGPNDRAITDAYYIEIPFVEFINSPRKYKYQGTFTFPKGRPEAYLAFGFEIAEHTYTSKYSMVLPFVIEGVVESKVPIVLGPNSQPRVIKEPSMPITVIHAPPGDESTVAFEQNKTTCRASEQTISEDIANSGNGSVKLGFKGSIGFVATIDIEAYVEFTASGTEGNSTIKTTNTETCLTTGSGFTTSPDDKQDIFVCESKSYNYGIYNIIKVNPATFIGEPIKGLALSPIAGSGSMNFLTKREILEEIELNRLDTLNMSKTLEERCFAKNQLNVWKQIITLNDNNIANANQFDSSFPANPTLQNQVALDRYTTMSTTNSYSIAVDHYIEAEVGIQGVVNIGGSGFSAGYNFRTSKSYGQTNSNTSTAGTNIFVHMRDNDAGDEFPMTIYKDPMYGTPIFKERPGQKSSCPYEGGYQRDQPQVLHRGIYAGQDTIFVHQPSTLLADAVSFSLELKNLSNESRQYALRVAEGTNNQGATIVAGNVNISQYITPYLETVPAGGSKFVTINISRANNAVPLFFPLIGFIITPACGEDDIASQVSATLNFGPLQPFISENTGNWADPETWIYKRLPKKTDDVIIESGTNVIVDTGTVRANTVKLKPNANLIIKAQNSLWLGNW